MLETKRMWLRRWKPEDVGPFAAMNRDAEVMRYFPALLSSTESAAMVVRVEEHFAKHGFGYWAVELKETGEFVGYLGLAVPTWEAHFTPCVEMGWKLAAKHWNRGFATEGAREVLRYAFEELGLEEVVAFTAVGNGASRRVMEKLGMKRDEDGDFDHPRIECGHALARHVLYRVQRGKGSSVKDGAMAVS